MLVLKSLLLYFLAPFWFGRLWVGGGGVSVTAKRLNHCFCMLAAIIVVLAALALSRSHTY